MKRLNYIDNNKGDYVSLQCQLKDEKQLNEFYSKMYRIPLEGKFNNSKSLAKRYHTGDFLAVFKNMVEEDHLDVDPLLDCIVHSDHTMSYEASFVTAQFFDLFEYFGEVRIPASEYEKYAYYCSRQGTFGSNTQKLLEKESKLYQNTGKLFDYIGYDPLNKEETKTVVKQKIVPFVLKERVSNTINA